MTKTKKKKLSWNDISNTSELIGYIFTSVIENWRIIVLLLLLIGITIGGCSVKTSFFEFQKDPINVKSNMETE